MRLARVGEPGREIPVLIEGDVAWDLRPLTEDVDGRFLADGGLERIAAARHAGGLPPVELGDLRFGPPIARPGTVVGVGMNYAAHAAESGSPAPTEPILFLKAASAVSGPRDAIVLPPGSARTDWEVELGVVIGAPLHQAADPADALRAVAGFVVVNDVSEREYQLQHPGGQWSKGKSFPGFAPTGPYLVTPDELEPSRLRLRSWVNGEPRQDSTSSDMIFGVDHLLWYASRYLALEPGDLVLTGTPEGVALSGRFPYLRPGDVVELEIEGLGRQRQHVVGAAGDKATA
jgi:2-keto-4-pentenoate hydratase/2-oxohepta-3-ene-1,7-dioic acid hydratase (catechol pathway)